MSIDEKRSRLIDASADIGIIPNFAYERNNLVYIFIRNHIYYIFATSGELCKVPLLVR